MHSLGPNYSLHMLHSIHIKHAHSNESTLPHNVPKLILSSNEFPLSNKLQHLRSNFDSSSTANVQFNYMFEPKIDCQFTEIEVKLFCPAVMSFLREKDFCIVSPFVGEGMDANKTMIWTKQNKKGEPKKEEQPNQTKHTNQMELKGTEINIS